MLARRNDFVRPLASIVPTFERFVEQFFNDDLFNIEPIRNFGAVDLIDDKDKYLLKVDVPGVSEKDISVKLNDNILTIECERKYEKEDNKNGIVKERYYGQFKRSLRLPDHIKHDKIDAKLKDGVLTITLPKDDNVKEKVIEVKGN